MKTPTVKVLLLAVAPVVLAVTPLVGRSVTVDVTRFNQRYPWNGLVDIDYTITRNQGESELDPAKNSIEIVVVNCDETPAVTNVAHVFRQGALPVSDGTHRVTWDANAEGVNFKSQHVQVFAEIVHYAEKYMVIDVHDGPNATVYPVWYLHGAPEGGFNDEYKGDRILLRLIPPGSFVMGAPASEPRGGMDDLRVREVQHVVVITKPFYIGVFEITQNQYLNVMNINPSQSRADYHPVEMVNYNTIRGEAKPSLHQYDWPWTNAVAETSFIGRLRAKCKEWDGAGYNKDVVGSIDLPTDAQWEYACRAGTMTPFNNGITCENDSALATELEKLGRYAGNNKGGGHAVVGSYAPNAWGLYDMHGNVWEWCRDWFREDSQNAADATFDPVGADSGAHRSSRGGSFTDAPLYCRSAFRGDFAQNDAARSFGFRLSMTLP